MNAPQDDRERFRAATRAFAERQNLPLNHRELQRKNRAAKKAENRELFIARIMAPHVSIDSYNPSDKVVMRVNRLEQDRITANY